jgi:hypothetical protein
LAQSSSGEAAFTLGPTHPLASPTLNNNASESATRRCPSVRRTTSYGSRLFSDAHGEQVQPHAISQAFERIAAWAEIPLIRQHDYADVRVMPISGCGPLHDNVIGRRVSA